MKYENENPKEHLERVLILAENSESYDAIVLAAEVRRLRRELGEMEYEYAIKRTRVGMAGNYANIVGNHWSEREEVNEGLLDLTTEKFEYKLVKRRKAGRIEDV